MNFIDSITDLIPTSLSGEIDWDRADRLLAGSGFSHMRQTPQNPVFHGEGDVYTHTQMVCRELVSLPLFHNLQVRQKAELFLAALLHDIGKVRTTTLQDGCWVSPHHSSAGSRTARDYLWRNCGLCGEESLVSFRETVCALIRWHMLPVHLPEQNEAERRIRQIAAIGELASGFSWYLLCILAEADVHGRLADDTGECLAQVEMTRLLAQEAGCLEGPYRFSDSFAKYAYLSGRNVHQDQSLFDDTWGEIIIMSGLPGTGKDTWIRENRPDLPVISLDDIRAEKHIKPSDDQGSVIRLAQEQARKYLRAKQPFVWNATGLSRDTRQKQIRLFEQYGASVRIVYLETDWSTRAERNLGRKNPVPEAAVSKMLEKTELPASGEASCVEWIFV